MVFISFIGSKISTQNITFLRKDGDSIHINQNIASMRYMYKIPFIMTDNNVIIIAIAFVIRNIERIEYLRNEYLFYFSQ